MYSAERLKHDILSVRLLQLFLRHWWALNDRHGTKCSQMHLVPWSNVLWVSRFNCWTLYVPLPTDRTYPGFPPFHLVKPRWKLIELNSLCSFSHDSVTVFHPKTQHICSDLVPRGSLAMQNRRNNGTHSKDVTGSSTCCAQPGHHVPLHSLRCRMKVSPVQTHPAPGAYCHKLFEFSVPTIFYQNDSYFIFSYLFIPVHTLQGFFNFIPGYTRDIHLFSKNIIKAVWLFWVLNSSVQNSSTALIIAWKFLMT